MSTFKKFEDIVAWQKARELTRLVYEITKTGSFSKDFGLRDQIRRASVSIMSNIAEGFDRGGRKEFIQYLSIAKGSVGEVKSQLYAALDQKYITEDVINKVYLLAEEINRLIYSLIKYLGNTDIKGLKYKATQ
jgi:four helix bundle protein